MLSFLLPSIRDPRCYAERVVLNINTLVHREPYEILICSPKPVRRFPHVRWCCDHRCDGSIAPINHLCQQARGDYVLVIVDDHLVSSDYVTALELIESPAFAHRKYKITSFQETWDAHTVSAYEHTAQIMPFPIARRDTVLAWGGCIFNPAFKNRWADNWLGWYLQAMGEPPLLAPRARLTGWEQNSSTKHAQVDEQVFFALARSLCEKKHQDYLFQPDLLS